MGKKARAEPRWALDAGYRPRASQSDLKKADREKSRLSPGYFFFELL